MMKKSIMTLGPLAALMGIGCAQVEPKMTGASVMQATGQFNQEECINLANRTKQLSAEYMDSTDRSDRRGDIDLSNIRRLAANLGEKSSDELCGDFKSSNLNLYAREIHGKVGGNESNWTGHDGIDGSVILGLGLPRIRSLRIDNLGGMNFLAGGNKQNLAQFFGGVIWDGTRAAKRILASVRTQGHESQGDIDTDEYIFRLNGIAQEVAAMRQTLGGSIFDGIKSMGDNLQNKTEGLGLQGGNPMDSGSGGFLDDLQNAADQAKEFQGKVEGWKGKAESWKGKAQDKFKSFQDQGNKMKGQWNKFQKQRDEAEEKMNTFSPGF